MPVRGIPGVRSLTSLRPTLKERTLGRVRGLGIDRALALLAAAAAILLFAFARLADEVMEGETRTFDERILLALRMPGDISMPIGPVWLQEMVRDFTALGSTGVLTIVTLGCAAFLVVSGKWRTAAFVVASVAGGVAVSSLLKLGFARPRPDLVPHSVVVFTNSFPSGHAMMSAIVYLTLGNLLARSQHSVAIKVYLMSLALFLTLLVGVSRVYLGVHWPSDVLAGWAVGAGWALICWLVMSLLQSAGTVEGDESRP